jgi:hypothetical protein
VLFIDPEFSSQSFKIFNPDEAFKNMIKGNDT